MPTRLVMNRFATKPSPAMTQIVQDLLDQKILQRVTKVTPSFLSKLFLRKKSDGSMRPIFDLRELNKFVKTKHFRLISHSTVPDFLKPGDWMIKLDISQAYFHVPAAKTHRPFLRISYLGLGGREALEKSGLDSQLPEIDLNSDTRPRIPWHPLANCKEQDDITGKEDTHSQSNHSSIINKRPDHASRIAKPTGTVQLRQLCHTPRQVTLSESTNLSSTFQQETTTTEETNPLRGVSRDEVVARRHTSLFGNTQKAGYSFPSDGRFGSGLGSWSPQQRGWHSNRKELYAVMAAIRANAAALSKSHVLVQSDNRTLIAYIWKEGGTRSLTLLGLTYKLLTLTDQFKITLSAHYLPGRYNTIADRLSRGKEVAEWHLLPQATGEVFRKWGPPEIDLFASRRSAVVRNYVSIDCRDQSASYIDAFSRPWQYQLAWVFPPPSLLPRVLTHLNRATGTYLVVAPEWPQVFWLQDLKSRALDHPHEIQNLSKTMIDMTTSQPPPQHTLKAIGVAKPKLVRPLITWDPRIVLEWLSANSPKETLFEISRRTATVLLLVSGRRVHDLTLLRISKGNYLDDGQNIYLIPAFGSKTDRHELSKHPDKNICPVSLVRCLIEITKQRRSDLRDLDNLFITICNKVKSASRTVIGNWVRTVLKDSGIDATPGSCRVNDDQEPIIAVATTLEDAYSHYPQVIVLSVKRYLRPTRQFFERMLAPGARVTADIYAYMFLCDFLNFLVVIFGFAAFGTHQGDGGVTAYLEENKVPIPFLVMLILQFGLIVIDRALYLRKFMLGKILFQYALIIGVHIWMFFVLPFITERTFNALIPPPMWYMVKCVYLLLSAYQIRCGYPRRIIGNFLCKSYRFINMICFRGFMAVPFLFELRTLMDWIWTDTSMTLMDWLKMEDIFASVFLLKCSRYVEDEFPQPRGVKKSATSKYLLGGGVLAFVIAIIWFPLVFFALGNSVGQPNPPTDVTVKIRIGPFLPVYQMTAQSHNIHSFTEQDYNQLSNQYARDRTAQTFLSNYMYNDVAVVTINPNSTMTWEISPPELARLEREAISNASLMVKFSYVVTHPSYNAQNPPTIDNNREVALDAYVDGKLNPERQTLLKMLANSAEPDTWLNVKLLFPKFVKVFNKGITRPAFQLMPPLPVKETDDARLFRDVQLRLERERGAVYWRVREACQPHDFLAAIPMNNCDMLVMYTFNDKLFPETLNFISGGGIIGLYTTFVFLASRVLRGFFSGIYTKIMFDDLPNVDRVLQLCLDIYLVREALELSLEEDLFAKLVFLYRSPETMIKWSRPKEDDSQEQRALPAPN
ncbi:unnamed protein product [Euphydryas editha]|uniref:Piezo non-specific cation channel R-Ras-binding domain-containing protein n=1 Tax=Euphydryas editha TaxID=104508 RepID=A0AAU9UXZ3_EUPED|nr:unnamed protein product [Euphydryas editha]